MTPTVVYFIASSLDGFIADDAGSLDWLTELETDPALAADFMANAGVQVMGSTTYQWLLDHEDLIAQPNKWREFFGNLATIVFSSRQLPVPDGADVAVLAGDVTMHIAMLRERADGRVIWLVGGGNLADQFLAASLLDRIEITYAPVLLGSGVPIMTSGVEALQLRSVAQHGHFVHASYEVQRQAI